MEIIESFKNLSGLEKGLVTIGLGYVSKQNYSL